MKNFAALSLVLALSIAGAAQSGRKRTVATKTTEPVEIVTENNKDDGGNNKGYSDSVGDAKLSRTARQPVAAAPSKDKTADVTPPTDDGDEVLRVDTALVTIPVTVADKAGRYLPTLQQSDFKIFENGVEQQITNFGTIEQPFTLILLIDTSPSSEYDIDKVHFAATNFINLLQSGDRVMVIEFDRKVNVLSEFTSDKAKLAKAIRKADLGDGTSIYDAVDDVLNRRLRGIEGRKAVVLFTDGVDTTSSRHSYDSSVRAAEVSDTIIFPVYYDTYDSLSRNSGGGGVMSSPFPFPFPFPGGGRSGGNFPQNPTRQDHENGKRYVEDLAAATGGRVFDSDRTGLDTAFASIAEELRRQYSLGYSPSNVGNAGERKKVKVRVMRPNLAVRARDSYIVGEK